jgi:uncharacterized membrane protein YhdT
MGLPSLPWGHFRIPDPSQWMLLSWEDAKLLLPPVFIAVCINVIKLIIVNLILKRYLLLE